MGLGVFLFPGGAVAFGVLLGMTSSSEYGLEWALCGLAVVMIASGLLALGRANDANIGAGVLLAAGVVAFSYGLTTRLAARSRS